MVKRIYRKDYYGFIYVWFDRRRKMYYVGSHMGSVDDGYVCSSTRMRNAKRRRPEDFRRRVIYYHSAPIRNGLLKEESRWLNMIRDEELGIRFYNHQRNCWGEELADLSKRWTPERKAKHAATVKAQWTPERKATHSAFVKEQWKTGSCKEKRVTAFKEKWRDPDYRAKRSEMLKAQWSDPVLKEKRSEAISEAMKQKWKERQLTLLFPHPLNVVWTMSGAG